MTERPAAFEVEALRAAMLESVRTHGDPRVVDLIAKAELVLDPMAGWVGSEGSAGAARLLVGLDVTTLHRVDAAPWIYNALVDVASLTLFRLGHVHLGDVRLYWAFDDLVETTHYRSADVGRRPAALDQPDAVAAAIGQWLGLSGEHEAATALRQCVLRVQRRRKQQVVSVVAPRAAAAFWREHPHAADALRKAAVALMRGVGHQTVVVAFEVA